jgi:hypothetical protein
VCDGNRQLLASESTGLQSINPPPTQTLDITLREIYYT